MKQIFEFTGSEVCAALLDYINAHLAHKFNSHDLTDVLLQEVLPDGNTEYIDGRIQLVIGDDDE